MTSFTNCSTDSNLTSVLLNFEEITTNAPSSTGDLCACISACVVVPKSEHVTAFPRKNPLVSGSLECQIEEETKVRRASPKKLNNWNEGKKDK